MIVNAPDTDWVLDIPPGGHVVALNATFLTGFYARAKGLEIRDTIMHVSPEGVEAILLCRKPLAGTVADTILEHGTGGLHIDACRIFSGPSSGGNISGSTALGQGSGWNAHNNRTTTIDRSMASGRWPPNLVFTHAEGCRKVGTKDVKAIRTGVRDSTGRAHSKYRFQGEGTKRHDKHYGFANETGKETVEAWDCAPACPVKALDEISGELAPTHLRIHPERVTTTHEGYTRPNASSYTHKKAGQVQSLPASGGASRFFPQFANRQELLTWLETLVG